MFDSVIREHGWTLQCTVNVKDTADSTYFCVVGWGPGGYSGIKQVDSNTRLAIFSMWNDEETNAVVGITKLCFKNYFSTHTYIILYLFVYPYSFL